MDLIHLPANVVQKFHKWLWVTNKCLPRIFTWLSSLWTSHTHGCQNKPATSAFHQLFWILCRLLWMLVGQFWTWYWRNKMEITTYFWMEPPTQKPTDNPGFVYHTSWRTSSPKRKFCDNIPTSHFNFSAQRRIVFG